MLNSIFQWAVRAIAGISKEQWAQILEYVVVAMTKSDTSEGKRAWVLDMLNNLGIKGSIANFLVESSVTYLKKIGALKS